MLIVSLHEGNELTETTVWNIEANRHNGLEVLFWRLDRSLNGRADAAAKREVNEMATIVNRRAKDEAAKRAFDFNNSYTGIVPERYRRYVRDHDEEEDVFYF